MLHLHPHSLDRPLGPSFLSEMEKDVQQTPSASPRTLIEEAINLWLTGSFHFVLRKKGSKTKKRMKEEEIEKGDCGPPTPKVFFFEILSDLNQAVPNHLADESQRR